MNLKSLADEELLRETLKEVEIEKKLNFESDKLKRER